MESTIESAKAVETPATPADPTEGKSVDEVRELYNAGKIDFQKYEAHVAAQEQATPVEKKEEPEKKPVSEKKDTPSKNELSEEEQYAKRYDTDGKRIKGLLEKDKHILKVNERARSAEARAEAAAHEAAETKKKLDALMAETQNRPKETVAKESTVAVEKAVEQGDLPEPPEIPSKPLDVYDEASVKEWNDYNAKKYDYDKKVNTFLRGRVVAAQGSKVDPDILKRLEDVEKQNKELRDFKDTSVKQIEAETQKLQTQQLYSTMDDFIKEHKGEYPLGKSIAVADSEYQLFMDDVARAAGVRKLGNDKYTEERFAAVQKWFDKDPAVLSACETNGVSFPFDDNEYKAYSEVCKIHELWNKLKTSDSESSVNDAWILLKHRSGQLDKEMTSQFVRGAKASEEVKHNRDSKFAKTIPVSDGTKQITAADLTEEQQIALRNEIVANPKLLETDPEKKRLYKELHVLMNIPYQE